MILDSVPTSPIALRLAADAALVLGSLLAAQGRAVRRNTPQLPGAAGPTAGLVDGPAPITSRPRWMRPV
jgi:hypothetical protein